MRPVGVGMLGSGLHRRVPHARAALRARCPGRRRLRREPGPARGVRRAVRLPAVRLDRGAVRGSGGGPRRRLAAEPPPPRGRPCRGGRGQGASHAPSRWAGTPTSRPTCCARSPRPACSAPTSRTSSSTRTSCGCATWSRRAPSAGSRRSGPARATADPHAAHFWDAELAGGGALLDMASHGVEVARYLFGKDLAVTEVFAWGDTLVHGARTTGEDNAVMVMRFEDGRAATCDVSWSSQGGLEGRFEVYGDAGRMVEDISVGSMKAFIERPAGYLVEKADAETGWVFPVPDEVRVHGHDLMMADVIEAFRDGPRPAVRRSATATSSTASWTPPTAPSAAGAGSPLPWTTPCWRRPPDPSRERVGPRTWDRSRDRRRDLAARGGRGPRARDRDAGRRHRDRQPVVCRCDRRGRPRPPVRHRPLADPGRGDVPALRVLPGVQPDRRAVHDVPHTGRGGQRTAPGDVHRARPGPRRGHPVQLPLRRPRRDDGLLRQRA